MNKNHSSANPSETKSKSKNIILKTVIISLIILAFVLFIHLYDYSYLNDGSEIFQSLKNGG